jgi:hypothetical protein
MEDYEEYMRRYQGQRSRSYSASKNAKKDIEKAREAIGRRKSEVSAPVTRKNRRDVARLMVHRESIPDTYRTKQSTPDTNRMVHRNSIPDKPRKVQRDSIPDKHRDNTSQVNMSYMLSVNKCVYYPHKHAHHIIQLLPCRCHCMHGHIH